MRSVAKHSYIKGFSGKARAKAHVNYIQYRRGEDRDENAREFFDKQHEGIAGIEVKRDIDAIERAPVVVHKLIMSPGVEGVDVQKYTREVLQEVGRMKGLDLDWRAVVHKNTDHAHAHVVVFGKDENGRVVKFNKDDYRLLREAGDRYLEREHFYDRFRDRDMERLVGAQQREYRREGDWTFQKLVDEINGKRPDNREDRKDREKDVPIWTREQAIERLPTTQKIHVGENTYSKYSRLEDLKELEEKLRRHEVPKLDDEKYDKLRLWIEKKQREGDDCYERKARAKWDEKHGREPQDIDLHWYMDQDIKKGYGAAGKEQSKGRKQLTHESRGMLAEDHGHYASIQEQQRLKDLMERYPERKEELAQQMEQVKQYDREQRLEGRRNWDNFDALLGENWKSVDKEKERKDRGKQDSGVKEKGQERAEDLSASKTFEAQRQVRDQKQLSEPEKERDAPDDSFGRGER